MSKDDQQIALNTLNEFHERKIGTQLCTQVAFLVLIANFSMSVDNQSLSIPLLFIIDSYANRKRNLTVKILEMIFLGRVKHFHFRFKKSLKRSFLN